MSFFIVLMAAFVGPLLVFSLSAWVIDRVWFRTSKSSESQADYDRRLDGLRQQNPKAFDPRTASEETRQRRTNAGCWLMALPVIVYIGFWIFFVAARGN